MQPRLPPYRPMPRLLLAALALGVVSLAGAQPKPPDKKLYCWDEGGRRVCSDALPASAVGRQRTEFDQITGTATRHVGRELTPAERARAAIEDEARKVEEQRRRREMAMVVSYETEEDLKRAFRERFDLVEESLKGSELALVNLHKSLISLLRQANELELQSKPVNKPMREKIREQHAELQALRAMKQRQLTERNAVNSDFEQALARYRALKGAKDGDTSALPTSVPATGG